MSADQVRDEAPNHVEPLAGSKSLEGGGRRKLFIARVMACMLILLPVLAGLAAGKNWPHANEDAYIGLSQVIGGLFIAIVLGSILGDASSWEKSEDKFLLVGLISIMWCGFFACVRAMLADTAQEPGGVEGGSVWLVGLAAAGVMAAAVLVSLSLFNSVRSGAPENRVPIVFLFLLPPVLLMIVF